MIRKTLAAAFTLIVCALAASAQNWYKYPLYNDCIDKVVETSTRVYYMSGNSLFSFSPSDNESLQFNSINYLSDNTIVGIYYNYDKKYLAVAYDNGNIDLLYDNGKIVNLPEIKNSQVTSSKNINQIAFDQGRMVVATDFGVVIYDDDKHEVVESGIYNTPILSAGMTKDYLIVFGGKYTDYKILFSPLGERHNNLDKFTTLAGFGGKYFTIIDDDVIAFREDNGDRLVIRMMNFENPGWTHLDYPEYRFDAPVCKFADGFFTTSGEKIIKINGREATEIDIPESLQGLPVSVCSDITKVWVAHPDGIARYDLSGSVPTMLCDKILPQDYVTDNQVALMKWSPDGERLYITNMGASQYCTFAKGERSDNYQTTNVIEGTSVSDISLKAATHSDAASTNRQKKFGNKRLYGDPLWVTEDPDDADRYYCATYYDGVFVVRRNSTTGEYEQIGVYNLNNAPFGDPDHPEYGPRTQQVIIDPEGNLWVGYQFGSTFSVLPASKRLQDPATVTTDDWTTHPKTSDLDYAQKDLKVLFCKHSNMIFYSMACYGTGMVAIDTKGTYGNLNDDVVRHHETFTDQDGNEVLYNYITSFVEDARGCVWVGTDMGVFEITTPADATSADMRIRRIKVPRNDGTNYADYLLGSDDITWIGVDPADRKWIATKSSGLFLVNETGDEIIRSYDTTNSPLPSNYVTTVECDNTDNTVYVGTTYGLYSFTSDATAGSSDYGDIYAYPNPVRPEYSGHVSITGLMDNSVVKIADTSGNVIFETRSEGGMAVWDVCGSNGNRVKSGVYYVFASTDGTGTVSGGTTKILVIN